MAKQSGTQHNPISQTKPPVVVVMGHVDHGKTTLLDTIRKSNVAAKEAGLITQHIGAYQVTVDVKRAKHEITFIDTPGHEAFQAMRARGVTVADVAILVVAADDSVKPQTIEAINHVKEAGIPMIVAINKVDLPTANVEKVKKDLAQHEVFVEGFGGDVVVAEISAKTGKGVAELLELITLVAELEELKADSAAPVMAAVIESRIDAGRGAVATAIIQQGTMVVSHDYYLLDKKFRVRALIGDNGKNLKEAGPATPCEIVGLPEVPAVGIVIEAHPKQIENPVAGVSKSVFDTFLAAPKDEVPIILKTDVSGSLEAIIEQLKKISEQHESPQLRIALSQAGDINESDINLAKMTNALVIGFNVRITAQARSLSQVEGVPYKIYSVIYELLEDIDALLASGMAIVEEKPKGEAEVIALFPSPDKVIAGVKVTHGRLRIGEKVAVRRNGDFVGSAKIKTMRHLKEDIKEISKNMEAGIVLDSLIDFQVGDMVQYSP